MLVPTIDAPEMRLSQQAEFLRLGDESGALMVTPLVPSLDVFALKNGESKWVSCADTITQAIESLRKKGCGLYFIFSQQTDRKTFYEVSAEGVVSQVDSHMHMF